MSLTFLLFSALINGLLNLALIPSLGVTDLLLTADIFVVSNILLVRFTFVVILLKIISFLFLIFSSLFILINLGKVTDKLLKSLTV